MSRKQVLTTVVTLLIAFCFFCPVLLASDFQPLYGQASIVMPADALSEFTFINTEGATDDDTFPNKEWCVERNANPKGPGCQPDGWITREDSPYYDVHQQDLGQKDLYLDYFKNTVTPYPGYSGSTPWNKLTPYGKLLAHMTNQYTVTLTGWDILIRAKVNTTVPAFNNWQQSVNPAGFSSDVAIVFTEDAFEINTHFFKYNTDTVAAVAMSGTDDDPSTPENEETDKFIYIDIHIPLSEKAVFDKLVEDFEQWNTVPVQKLQTVEQTEEATSYKK